MISALPLASARLSKLWILYLNDVLDGDLCKNFILFPYFLLFWFSNMILFHILIVLVSQLQTEQVMTSQIRSHTEYLIQTYYIIVLISQSKLMKNLSLMTVFNTIKWWYLIVAYFFCTTLYIYDSGNNSGGALRKCFAHARRVSNQ